MFYVVTQIKKNRYDIQTNNVKARDQIWNNEFNRIAD